MLNYDMPLLFKAMISVDELENRNENAIKIYRKISKTARCLNKTPENKFAYINYLLQRRRCNDPVAGIISTMMRIDKYLVWASDYM